MQWLIDIIKEWVIDQAYATEAWVLEKLYLQKAEYPGYGMPVHVTGETDPDVTCTYFRAGDYLGVPYYSQEDGSYFIWWSGTKWIIGTSVPGGPGTRMFQRVDLSVFGLYVNTPGNSGTPIVVSGYKYLLTGFVDRGDPPAWDWTHLDLDEDGAWHDLDLSAIVPEDTKGVLFKFYVGNSVIGKVFRMRRKGNAGGVNASELNTQVANLYVSGDFICPCDSDRKVQYYATAGGWIGIYLTVKAWW